jgi:hypothetical protein
VQSTVTCGAAATGSTTVTAVLTDSTGATKTITSPLTFATGTTRPVTVNLTAASQDGATPSVCTGATFPVRGQVIDTASGQPVKGLAVSFSKQASNATLATAAGSGTTGADGAATLNQSETLATTYSAKTTAGTVYAAAAPASLVATPGTCTVALTGSADRSAIYYGDPVTVTGTLTRQVGGATVPVVGASLPVKITSGDGPTARVTTLGSAVTAADGSYRLVVKPTVSGSLSVEVVGSTAYVATKVALGPVTVSIPDTRLTASVTPTAVGYGNPVTVSGTLNRNAGGTITALNGSTVTLKVTPANSSVATVIGSARVAADGTFSAAVPLRISGALAVTYAGAPGQPAATAAAGTVTAGTWTTTIAATASATAVPIGGGVTFGGTLTRSYADTSGPAPSLRVSVWFTPAGATTRTLMTTTSTTIAGAFTLKVFPKVAGTWTVGVDGVAGYAGVTSDGFAVSVG